MHTSLFPPNTHTNGQRPTPSTHLYIQDFRGKRHDLLDCHNGKFDRDFAEFNARIAELEAALQGFINQVRCGVVVLVFGWCLVGVWLVFGLGVCSNALAADTHQRRKQYHTPNQSFENITSIEHSLQLLRRFQARQAAA